uniref:Uncharacterized protein n=1 Tax=Anguilla anguilla TaxID=7936 RepID=A0A0E9UIJ4_ANGAN
MMFSGRKNVILNVKSIDSCILSREICHCPFSYSCSHL